MMVIVKYYQCLQVLSLYNNNNYDGINYLECFTG